MNSECRLSHARKAPVAGQSCGLIRESALIGGGFAEPAEVSVDLKGINCSTVSNCRQPPPMQMPYGSNAVLFGWNHPNQRLLIENAGNAEGNRKEETNHPARPSTAIETFKLLAWQADSWIDHGYCR